MEKFWIDDDGIRLSAVLETPESGVSGGLVLVLHGFSSQKEKPHTLLTAQAMREAGFATLRFDLYGHGESGGRFRDHTLYRWIENTLAVIREAREMGYTDIFLSGHSQGGLTAALVGGMEGSRIRGLILRAPAFQIPQACRDGMMLGHSFDPEHIPDSVPIWEGMELGGDYIRVAQTLYAEETAERYKGPVLIVHGTEDDVVPPEGSRIMAERYANCELAEIAGETHHFDRHPEQMRKIIFDWMEKQK